MAKRGFIDVQFDFSIWGINSNMEDYRLCLQLNNATRWHLKREPDIEFYSPKIKEYKHFNVYKFKNVIDFYTIELIQNKNSGNILIPELKNFDFLFLLHGEDDYFDINEFTQILTQISGVQSCLQIDVNSLKSRNNLLIRHFNENNKKKNENSSYYWAG
jgi:hypothetical protein